MTAAETMRVFALMQRLFPRDDAFNVPREELIKMADAWSETLSDVSMQDAEEAIKNHARRSIFPPSICEIAEYAEAKHRKSIYDTPRKKEVVENGRSLRAWLDSREFSEENKELLRKAMQIMQ